MKFGYARVSKNDQNLDLQIDALNTYGVDEIYEEKVTGTQQQRQQQLVELMVKLRTGDTLVIWRLDRLGRTVKQLLGLVEEFKQKGINLVSLQESFDTTTPMGKFVFVIFCAMAQMERDIISERTKAGMKAASRRGRFSGRKPKNAKNVETALKMYFSNEFPVSEILETLKISKSTLYKYIRRYKAEGRGNENGKSE